MFIYSIKFNKKKAVAIVLAVGIILCIVILLAGKRDAREVSASGQRISSQEDVAEYLESLGWEISDEPIDVQKILIPKEFSDVYEKYNELQKKQGYDLTEYSGIDAVRYTYEILNYPGEEDSVVADIIVADNKIIAADIQSVKIDGFMHELRENKTASE